MYEKNEFYYFSDTSYEPDLTEITVIDERFYHSGNSGEINKKLVKLARLKILMDKIDQPGNQVVLARKESL